MTDDEALQELRDEERYKRKYEKHRKEGTSKLPGWQPMEPPDVEMCKRLRQYVVEAVFSRYNQKKKESTLLSIYVAVDKRVEEETPVLWPRRWGRPSKRTIDRRVNEAADPRFYGDGVPKIVAVTAGRYTVNPKLLEAQQ